MLWVIIIILATKFKETALVCLLGYYCYTLARNWLYKNKVNTRVKLCFEGNINELTEELICQLGLELKDKVGEYYLYGSNIYWNANFTFLLNGYIHARKCGSFCEILSNNYWFKELIKLERFKQLKESEKNNFPDTGVNT